MSLDKIFIPALITMVILIVTMVNFRKMLYAWILLAGAMGIPILVVRESRLMLSELLIALLLSFWFLETKLNFKIINLPPSSGSNTNLERSMWAMVLAFSASSVFSIIFPDQSVGGEHTFVLGKLMALFIYVASVMTALLISDTITSLVEVRRVCILMILLGLFTFVAQLQGQHGFLQSFQRFVEWDWMSVTILFSFALAYLLFDQRSSKKLQSIIVSVVILGQILYSFFTGTATYKAPILVNFVIIFVIFYYRYRKSIIILFSIGAVLILSTSNLLNYYVAQERNEGSMGRIDIWQHSLSILAERPIFGIGPYNYYDYSIYVAAKKSHSDPKNALGVFTSPHGQYVQLLTETGLLGAAAFLWFLFELYKFLKDIFSLNSDDHIVNMVASALSAIVLSRLAVGIVGDYLIPQYHNGGLQTFCSTIYFWVSLGVLISLRRIAINANQSP